ncbi:hypothetical protein ILUMI_03304 [Ignelater luminosus]|uniref:Fibrillar collagen NC1 domain-containing protein n=1 Tax=Ignelater luminosus TaxID=2038154 RepID=A0A8K0DGK8_IGNLU|nr:hypothetical protein ILUMI_03304 [Ignelater luminosus]
MVTQNALFNNEDGSARAMIGNTSYNNRRAALEDLTHIDSRFSRFKKRIYVILLIVAIILGIFLVIFVHNSRITDTQTEDPICTSEDPICTSEECIRSAAHLRLSMDFNVDPCDDFYKFTCGRWDVEHPSHIWHYEYTNFDTVKERIMTKLLTLLETNVSASEPLPLQQMKDLYTSCTDTDTLDSLGYTDLFKYLKKLHLPTLPRFFNSNTSKNSSSFDWIKREVAMRTTLGAGVFVDLLVGPNIYNTTENVIYMGFPNSNSLLPGLIRAENKWKPNSWYNRNKRNEQKKLRYTEITYGKDVLEVLAVVLTKVSKKVDAWLAIHAARTIWSIKEDLERLAILGMFLENQIKVLKVDDIPFITHSNKEWRRYLTMVFNETSNVKLDLDNKDYIYTSDKELLYLRQLMSYLSKLPDSKVELFMWWVAVHTVISSTPAGYYTTEDSRSFKASDIKKIRTTQCVNLVTKTMKYAVTYAIAERDFIENARIKADEIVDNIRDAFEKNVKSAIWLDSDAKKAVLEKSENLISLIGFPEWLLNVRMLEDFYRKYKIQNNTFFDNIMGIAKTETHLNLASLREENARTWKGQNPIEVNAQNYLSYNLLVLPMAILTHPFYNLGLESLNYGALGSTIGHELVHGFDLDGIKYNKWGYRKAWMSNETARAIIRRLLCFVEQYDEFSVSAVNKTVNGYQTLSENLADSEGLRLSYSAYQHHSKYGKEPKLPGFESFSKDQMFFIAYTSIWCGTTDTDLLEYEIEYDEHSPKHIRVLGSLQNSHEFAEAFKCPIGSKFNPKRTRCKVW